MRLTHPDRVLYPEVGITKLDLARYYEAIERWIVPEIRGRPLTLVRCPDGLGEECFYMKHSKVWAPPALRHVRIQEKQKIGDYLVADDLAGVISLVQMSVLEIHTWNSVFERLEQPDRVIFDLDPGPEVSWPEILDAARVVRQVLQALELESFVKTTGGAGLHVVVPLLPDRDWDECYEFSRTVAAQIAAEDPGRFTIAIAKKGRERKILIDYLRNKRANTAVAAFSTRASAKAPVSVPVDWRELSPRMRSDAYDVKKIQRRLAKLAVDPWGAMTTIRQEISDAALEALTKAASRHRAVRMPD